MVKLTVKLMVKSWGHTAGRQGHDQDLAAAAAAAADFESDRIRSLRAGRGLGPGPSERDVRERGERAGPIGPGRSREAGMSLAVGG